MRELRGVDVAEDVLSVSTRYGETEEETDREIDANGHTNPKSHSNPIAHKSNRTQERDFERAYLFSRPKKIYEERDSNPPRGPLDATLKIEIYPTHRAKDESNDDAPRESQQSTIRQTC